MDDRSVSSEVFSVHGTQHGDGVMANLARMHNRLLHNTVEMYTTPEMYPIWKTSRPVVVIDNQPHEGEEELIHRYRYVAVTPGATIDWDLIKKEEDDGNSTGRNTVSTTPPGSDVEDNEEEHLLMQTDTQETEEEVEEEGYFPPVLYENPAEEAEGAASGESSGEKSGEREDAPRKHHHRTHSLFDAHGNPIVLTNISHEEEPVSAPVSQASFSSFASERPTVALTWEAVSALPYRTRCVNTEKDGDNDHQIVDNWNVANDPSFQNYWKTKEDKTGVMTDTTVTPQNEQVEKNDDDDLMDDTDAKNSIYIVCYHLPVILTRDPASGEWTACWSESLIAKSEIQSVASTRRTIWLGTVSNIPQECLNDEKELDAIKEVLMGMNCIPVFFNEEKYDSVVEFMYLGFCKQVLWPSFHNVDLLDLATNGWGQRQRNTRSDPVQACALAEAEANERKRSESLGGAPPSPGDGGSQKLRSDWDQVRVIC